MSAPPGQSPTPLHLAGGRELVAHAVFSRLLGVNAARTYVHPLNMVLAELTDTPGPAPAAAGRCFRGGCRSWA